MSRRDEDPARAAASQGLEHLRRGRYAEAVDALAAALEADSTEPDLSTLVAAMADAISDPRSERDRRRLLNAAADNPIVFEPLIYQAEATGREAEAMAWSVHLVEQRPDVPGAHTLLATRLAVRGDMESALEEVEIAIQLDPDSVLPHALRADIETSRGDMAASANDPNTAIAAYQAAEAGYGHLLTLLPDSPSVLFSRAQVRNSLEDLEGAGDDVDRVLTLDPENPDAHNLRGLLFEQQADYEQALEHYQRVIELAPDSPIGFLNRADTLMALGRVDDALTDYETAVALAPASGEARAGIARVLATRGQYGEALDQITEAIRAEPDNPSILALQADVELTKGDDARLSGDEDTAIAAYQAAEAGYGHLLTLLPDSPSVLFSRAQVRNSLEDLEGAGDDVDRVLTLDPENPDAHNLRGLLFEQQADYEQALEHYQRVIELAPDSPIGFLNRADTLMALGRVDDALTDYETAVALAPASGEARAGIARVLATRGQYGEALDQITEAIRAEPDNPSILALQADVELTKGDDARLSGDEDTAIAAYQAAEAGYGHLLTLLPDSPSVLFSRAQVRNSLEDLEGAGDDVDRVLTLDPENPDAHNLRGLLFEQQADYEQALEHYQRVIELAPDSPIGFLNRADTLMALGRVDDALTDYETAVALAPASGEARAGIARVLATRGQYGEALDQITEAIRAEPDNPSILALQADVELTKGDDARLSGDEDTAIAAYQAAEAGYGHLLTLLPDSPSVLFSRAQVRNSLEDLEGAGDDVDRVLTLDPENPDAHNLRGLLFEQQADYEQALEHYQRVIELAPDSPIGFLNRADTLMALGRVDDALTDYETAVALAPASGEARAGIARVLATRGQYGEALDQITEAIRAEPDNPSILALQADVELTKGDDARLSGDEDTAIAAYQAAEAGYGHLLTLLPDSPSVLFSRAQVRNSLEDLEGAGDDVDRVLTLDPENPDAHNLRGLLFEQQADYEQALEHYQRVIELAPEEPNGYVSRGDARRQLGQYHRSLWDYERALKLDAQNAWAHLGRGLALLELGEMDFGQGRYRQAIEKSEAALEAGDHALEFGYDVGSGQWLRGLALRSLESYDEAVAAFDLALAAMPAHLDTASAELDRAETLRLWGMDLEDEEALAQATSALKRVIEISEDPYVQSPAYASLGVALAEQGHYERAQHAFRASLELDADFGYPMLGLANALLLSGDVDEAEPVYRQLLESEAAADLEIEARVGLGLTLERQSRFEEAAEAMGGAETVTQLLERSNTWIGLHKLDRAEHDLRRAVEVDPEAADALNLLAWFLVTERGATNSLDEAVALAERALAAEGDGEARANYVDTLAWAHFRRGELARAAELLEEATRLLPRPLDLREHLATVQEELARA